MTPDSERYAIYWAPDAAHPLWAAGCDWLGRDPSLAPDAAARKPARPHVATPARYGFHATLKAPIRLAARRSLGELRCSAAALARRHPVFEIPALHFHWLRDFFS